MELIEDARLMLHGNSWPRIGHADIEVAVDRLGGYAHLALIGELVIGELDGGANEVESTWVRSLFIAK